MTLVHTRRTPSIALTIVAAVVGAAVVAALNRYWVYEDWTRALRGAAVFLVVILIVFLALAMIRQRRSPRK